MYADANASRARITSGAVEALIVRNENLPFSFLETEDCALQ